MICSAGVSIELFSILVGCDRKTPYKWIKGKITPSVETLIRIREEFGVSIDWIPTGEGEQWIKP